MSSIKRLVVPMIIAIAIVFSLSSVKGKNVNVQECLCNHKVNSYGRNGMDRSYIEVSLIDETPTHGYSQHVHLNGFYGAAACNGEIPKEDCYDCLVIASRVLYASCGFSDGGQIKLVDCRLRFEKYEILDW